LEKKKIPKSSLTSLSAQEAALNSFSILSILGEVIKLDERFSYGIKRISQVENVGSL
jgi:hypothetical protein